MAVSVLRPTGSRPIHENPGGTRLGLLRLGIFVAFLVIWWLGSAFAGGGFLPSPIQTIRAGIKVIGNGAVPRALLDSLAALSAGYALAAIVAVPCGLLMGGFRTVGLVLEPYVDALSAMPRVAFIPLVIVFLGLGYEAKIFLVFLGAVMPILINTYAGVLNCDDELIEMARSAGARDLQIFRTVMLPGALPYIVAGLRIGASLALINTVVAELYTSVQGLGGLLAVYGNSFRMAPYFVVVIVLALLGITLMQGLKCLERRIAPWRHGGEPS